MSAFTVAICTYQRGDVLAKTLDSLAGIDRPDVPWDVLVVDNAADPRVKQMVNALADRLPVRYVAEPSVGIARARNRAVESTEAPVIFFADDDVVFDAHWLTALWAAVRGQSGCDFWGGRIEPTWDVPQPAWFDMRRCPMLGDSIVRYDAGPEPRPWDPQGDPPFYTCNLALRCSAIRAAGMFDVTLGHQGRKRGGGEDSWMIRSIARAGGRGWYAADALLYHPVPAARVTRRHARAFAWWQGRVGVEMLRRETGGRVPRWAYRAAVEEALRGSGRWLAGTVRRDPAAAFTGQFTAIYQSSRLVHALFGSAS